MEIFHQTKLGTGLRAVSLNTRLAKRAVLATAGWIAASPLFGGVVINEIHYHPTSEDVREEFVELHNTGDQAVNLESWSLRRGVRFDFPKATVPPHGYLVVAADAAVFADRKSTRLNSSHALISYAVFCLKKKNKQKQTTITAINNPT